MAVSITVAGVDTTNIETYSIDEDATGLDPSQFSGGTGQITATFDTPDNPRQLLTKPLVLSTDEFGTMEGTVRDVSGSDLDNSVNLSADTELALFNAWKSVQSYTGTLANALTYYFSLISGAPGLIVDASIASRAVTFPGWEGNLWDGLKQICSAEQIEMSQSGSSAIVRPLRTKAYTLVKSIQPLTWTVNQQTTSNKVRIHYYGNQYRNDGEIFPVPPTPPLPGEDISEDSETVYTVDAGERQVFEVQLSASIDFVNQPTCVNFVYDKDYSGTNGVYAVSGNDDLPVTAAQWLASGGSVKAETTDNPLVLKITVIGANIANLAPFRLAMSAGSGSYYNSLHLTGDGVFQTDNVIDISTGAGNLVTGEEIGAEVTNPFINTLSKALFVGQQTAGRNALSHTISGGLTGLVTAAGVPGEIGELAGGIVQEGAAKYRLTSVSLTPDSLSVQGEVDVLNSDFNTLGLTTAQFNALWSGKSCLDFSLDPLRK